MNVTVLGGRGLLGRHLSPLLEEAGHRVLAVSRSSEPAVDMATGEGFPDVVADADVVVNLASDPRKAKIVDLEGTRRLLDVLGDRRLVYMSIVGVDRHPFPYYQVKYQVEKLIEASGLDHAILRATQFHDFLAFLLGLVCRPPVAVVPRRVIFQPIATSEVARTLAELVIGGETGRVPDIAGPEVLGIEHLARTYMEAIGKERPLLEVPLPGKSARAFREGAHTNPGRAVGTVTWADYLAGLRGEDRPPY